MLISRFAASGVGVPLDRTRQSISKSASESKAIGTGTQRIAFYKPPFLLAVEWSAPCSTYGIRIGNTQVVLYPLRPTTAFIRDGIFISSTPQQNPRSGTVAPTSFI